jgi:alanine racemase
MGMSAPASEPRGDLIPPGWPGCAVIDLDAIADNVRALREAAGPAPMMAVVKADGYGHGLLPAARAAVRGGADWLGVAQLGEALQLRAAGITVPVLAWLAVPGDAFPEAVSAGIDLGVSARWALDEIAVAARETGRTARIHLKLDTGLSRNGVAADGWADLVDAALKLQAEEAVDLVGAMSHLAIADDPGHPTVRAQTAAFTGAVRAAERAGARFTVRHLANSAATLTAPDTHFDLVRPGLAVYGLSPVPQVGPPERFGLRPAMSLLGRVALVKRVPAGTGVSYGHTYITPRDTTVALIPLGYGDGVPRHGSGAGPVAVRGRTYRIAGRVCMDQVVLDLDGTDNPTGVAEGDPAVLFGDGAGGGPTAQDWAEAADTINYEIVTRLGARLPRRYLGAGAGPGTAEDPVRGRGAGGRP